MIFDAFWYHLCNIVIFDGFERLILDLCGYLLIRAMDGRTDCASSSQISILGCVDLWFGSRCTRAHFDLLIKKLENWKYGCGTHI